MNKDIVLLSDLDLNNKDLVPYTFELKKVQDKKLLSGFFTHILLNIEESKKESVMLMVIDMEIDLDNDNLMYFESESLKYSTTQVELLQMSMDFYMKLMESPNDPITLDDIRNLNIELPDTMFELEYLKNDLLGNEMYDELVIVQEKIDKLNK
tara:strand:- start:2872 stop:3330 length:459 start_codon:yes stop_codon:yes gene_type:complete